MKLLTLLTICSVFQPIAITNAIINVGSQNKDFAVTTISTEGQQISTRSDFKNAAEAAGYAKKQLALGNHVELGVAQIPSGWLDKLSKRGATVESLMYACRNVAVATDLLNEAAAYCAPRTDSKEERDLCALSFYKTGSPTAGLEYAKQILAYADAHPVDANSSTPKTSVNTYETDPRFSLPKPTFSTDVRNKIEDAGTDAEQNDSPQSADSKGDNNDDEE